MNCVILTIRLIGVITLTVQAIVIVNPIMVEQIVQHQINVQDMVIGLTVAAIAHARVDGVELIARNKILVPEKVIGRIVLMALVIVLLVIVVGVVLTVHNKILVPEKVIGIIVLTVLVIVLVIVVGVEKIAHNLWQINVQGMGHGIIIAVILTVAIVLAPMVMEGQIVP